MDVTLIAAALGVAGVLIAALWNSFDGLLRDRRRVRADARVAAAFVRHELDENVDRMNAACNHRRWWARDDMPAFPLWGQHATALLVAKAIKNPDPVHNAISDAERLARLALVKRRIHDSAEERLDQRLGEIARGIGVELQGDETEGHAKERARRKAEEKAIEDVAAAEIRDEEQLKEISDCGVALAAARDAVPEHVSGPLRRLLPVMAAAAVIATFAIGATLWLQPDVDPDQLAATLAAERGAAAASCDPVDKVSDTFKCELAYIADGPLCDPTTDGSRRGAVPAAYAADAEGPSSDCSSDGPVSFAESARLQLEADAQMAWGRITQRRTLPADQDDADSDKREKLGNKLKKLPKSFYLSLRE